MGESEKYGIKELDEALVFGLSAGKAAIVALADGFQPGDLFVLLPALQTGPEAFAGINKVPTELADLSDAEVDHLVGTVRKYLGEALPTEKAKAIAFKGVQFGLVAVQLLNAVRS